MKASTVIYKKDGTSIPEGTECTLTWSDDNARVCVVKGNDISIKCFTTSLPKYFKDIEPPPALIDEDDNSNYDLLDSVVQSVLGHDVEPDGWDPEGSPSWLLAMGVI
jgi:hypothetical protein